MSRNYDALGYYQVLEVTPIATTSQIKQQYYKCAKYWHPDHNEKKNALEIFQKISVAYNVLKEQKSRIRYDLLSFIYSEKDFPEMNSLKIYKNQSNKEDIALRVLRQKHVVCGKVRETKDVCSYREAKDLVLSTSISNWIKGWWGKNGINNTISSIRFNLTASKAQDEDNLKLLIHNSLAYEQENKIEMAWIYAKQASMLLRDNTREQELMTTYINLLDYHPQSIITLPRWVSKELRVRQLIIPIFMASIIMVYAIFAMEKIGMIKIPQHIGEKSYYSEVVMANGGRMADDQIERRLIRVDNGDVSDSSFLYHLTADVKIYYGPDERYDVMNNGKKGQTVRFLGYMPNNKWYKIMIDNGETGYVNSKYLKKGKGNPLPPRTRIYR